MNLLYLVEVLKSLQFLLCPNLTEHEKVSSEWETNGTEGRFSVIARVGEEYVGLMVVVVRGVLCFGCGLFVCFVRNLNVFSSSLSWSFASSFDRCSFRSLWSVHGAGDGSYQYFDRRL